MSAPRRRRSNRSNRSSDGTYGRRSYPRRRRASTASTLGTAVGALIAGALYVLLGQLPWWAWAGLIVLGLLIGYLLHRRRVGT